MIILCSPTKTMRQADTKGTTIPIFIDEAFKLVQVLKDESPEQLKKRFKVNDKLAKQIYDMYQNWDKEGQSCALDTFNGLQFKQVDSLNLSLKEREYAYNHLYILSGLYGIIRASDNIGAYRLDVDDGFAIMDIYQAKIETFLKNQTFLNLASKEYSALINNGGIKVSFLTKKDGKLLNLATYAKMQRGKMLKYCISKQIENIKDLENYHEDNYYFNKELSTDDKLVFIKED